MVGGCDSGYSCAYSNTISWSSPTTPLPYENNPSRVFARLFGDGDTTDPAAREARARQDRSLLDFVREDAGRLRTRLGRATGGSWAITSTPSARWSAASATRATTASTCR